MNFNDFLKLLKGVTGSDPQYMALCPAHDDRTPSLSVKRGDDGRTLVYCHAGCSCEEVVAAMGLTCRDLMPPNDLRKPSRPSTDGPVEPLTMERVSQVKRLPIGLLNEMKVRQSRRGIVIPYMDVKGAQVATRYRSSLDGGWRWKKGDKPIPYGLWRLREVTEQHDELLLVEGESDSWTAWHHGLPALGLPGADMTGKIEAHHLRSFVRLYIVQEPDKGGKTFVAGLHDRLQEIGYQGEASVILFTKENGEDLSGLHIDDPARFVERFTAMKDAAVSIGDAVRDMQGGSEVANPLDKAEESGKGPKQLDLLLEATKDCVLFSGDDGETYAALPGESYCVSLQSKMFEHHVRHAYFQLTETLSASQGISRAPSKEALNTALSTLEARARFEPDIEGKQPVRLRTAGVRDAAGYLAAVYIDLADDEGRVVKVTPDGWQVVKDAVPVRFVRTAAQHALPVPDPSGSLDDLLPFLRTEQEREKTFVIAWLLFALHPEGPYPVLVVNGPAGSGKSTLCRFLRTLIDPVSATLRRPGKTSEDLFVAAKQNAVVALENISKVSDTFSDDLCSIATGASFAARTLYTNAEETAYSFKRPILINGIDEFVVRDDLASRALKVHVPSLEPEARRGEVALREQMAAAQPRILGGLCDALVEALRRPEHRPERLPRMADFAAFVDAASARFPAGLPTIMDALEGLQDEMARDYLDNASVAAAVYAAVRNADSHPIEMTVKDMWEQWSKYQATGTTWPQSPRGFVSDLRRAESVLRHYGVRYRKLQRRCSSTRRTLYELWLVGKREADQQEIAFDVSDASLPPGRPESGYDEPSGDGAPAKLSPEGRTPPEGAHVSGEFSVDGRQEGHLKDAEDPKDSGSNPDERSPGSGALTNSAQAPF